MDPNTVANGVKPSDRHFKKLTAQLPVQLRFKPRTKTNTAYPGLRLPFTAKGAAGFGTNFWAMPEAEGYTSGCDLGHFAAVAFIRARSESPQNCIGLSVLVMDAVEANGGKMSDSQRGAIVGFFGEMSRWLDVVLAACGERMATSYTDAELEYRMSEAASRTPEEALAKVRADALVAGVELRP